MNFRFLLALLLLLWCAPATRGADSYRSYSNTRFGTVVQYPSNLLSPRAESENGDGRKFVSRDGSILLTVFASNNAFHRTLAQMQSKAVSDWKSDKARLTYSKTGPNWFVLSGYLGADIFYEKTVLWNGAFHTLIWQYPQTQKARMDAPVTRAVRGFEAKNFVRPTLKTTRTPKTNAPRNQKPRVREGY